MPGAGTNVLNISGRFVTMRLIVTPIVGMESAMKKDEFAGEHGLVKRNTTSRRELNSLLPSQAETQDCKQTSASSDLKNTLNTRTSLAKASKNSAEPFSFKCVHLSNSSEADFKTVITSKYKSSLTLASVSRRTARKLQYGLEMAVWLSKGKYCQFQVRTKIRVECE